MKILNALDGYNGIQEHHIVPMADALLASSRSLLAYAEETLCLIRTVKVSPCSSGSPYSETKSDVATRARPSTSRERPG
jgi:hypothetical protein